MCLFSIVFPIFTQSAIESAINWTLGPSLIVTAIVAASSGVVGVIGFNLYGRVKRFILKDAESLVREFEGKIKYKRGVCEDPFFVIDEYRGKKLLTGGEVKDVDLPMQVFDRRFFDAVLRVKPDIDVHIRIDINGKDQSKSIKVGDRVKVVGEIEHIEFGDAHGDRVELIHCVTW